MRDVKEFQERFNRYKNGESVNEIYNLPKYGDGKPGKANFTKLQEETLSSIYNTFKTLGYDDNSIFGILGNALTESSLDPDSVSDSKSYHGLLLNSTAIKKAILNKYGDYSLKNQMRYVHAWVSGDDWVKKNPDLTTYNGRYKMSGYKSASDAADAFTRFYERPVILNDSGKVIGYQKAKERMQNAELVALYFANKNGIKTTTLPDGNKKITIDPSMYLVPEYKSTWLPAQPIKTEYPLGGSQAPESLSSWNAALSPSATPTIPSIQKINNEKNSAVQGAFLLPGVTVFGNKRASLLPKMPSLNDVFMAYSPLNLMNRAVSDMLGLNDLWEDLDVTSDIFRAKNGKLPRYEDGKDDDFETFKQTLPDNQKNTPEYMYRTKRYWELNGKPKNFGEAIGRGMYTYEGDGWHANSVAYNESAGEYEFMKPNYHNTKMMEDAWYYSKDGEEFRNLYTKTTDPTGVYDKYIPKKKKGIIGLKNGKLPRYKGGKVNLGANPTNATINSDGTFTDDYTKVWDDLTITPKGVRVKNLYRYQEPWDDEKFLNAVTVGGLNNLMPSLWIRRGYDLATGNLTTDSWLNGNAGVVPNSYAKEHPLMSMAANGLIDFWTLGGPKLLKSALSTGTKLNPVLFTKYESLPVQERLVKPQLAPKQFEIELIPGYQLKSLMRGNALEKQLSKQGTISVNSIRAHANKASEVEKSVIDKVLSSEEFAGLKSVDYNKFRKAVHDDLVTYDVIPDAQYEDYGVDRLGFSRDYYNGMPGRDIAYNLKIKYPDRFQEVNDPFYGILDKKTGNVLRTNGDFEQYGELLNQNYPKLNTYTFESPRIGAGNNDHYDITTLGHSRTYTTLNEPTVLHVMESQSDWGLKTKDLTPKFRYKRGFEGNTNVSFDENGRAYYTKDDKGMPYTKFVKPSDEFGGEWPMLVAKQQFLENYPMEQVKHLHDNYQFRQIQENLRYAAERGLTKMRYPTPDTAAKIEGYSKSALNSQEAQELRSKIQNILLELNNISGGGSDFIPPSLKEIKLKLEELNKLNDQLDIVLTSNKNVDYSSEHKTILKKYADFPKQFKKLHKNAEVREVTDEKGNTWYEVDVPKDFLKKEWMYGIGAATVLKPRKNKITE